MNKRIYLDNNATTPLDERVFREMEPYYKEYYGNPSSIHWFGQIAKKAIDEAREKVACFIGAKPSEIIFTGSGTEADNLALFGIVNAYGSSKRKKIIISAIEHHAILHSAEELKERGFEVTMAPANAFGVIDLIELKEMINEEVLLISVMACNNETGVIQPIREIAELAKSAGVIFHTDAVQAAGKIHINVKEIGCALLSLSAHKMYGPKGIGALYVSNEIDISPMIFGGGQERGRRAGTENVSHIVGFGKACELSMNNKEEIERIRKLRDKLENSILANIKDAKINGKEANRVCNTINISFPNIDAETLVINLDLKGIALSTGAACSSGKVEISHVLKAMNLPKEYLTSTIRISLGRFNTEEEINYAAQEISKSVESMKKQ